MQKKQRKHAGILRSLDRCYEEMLKDEKEVMVKGAEIVKVEQINLY